MLEYCNNFGHNIGHREYPDSERLLCNLQPSVGRRACSSSGADFAAAKRLSEFERHNVFRRESPDLWEDACASGGVVIKTRPNLPPGSRPSSFCLPKPVPNLAHKRLAWRLSAAGYSSTGKNGRQFCGALIKRAVAERRAALAAAAVYNGPLDGRGTTTHRQHQQRFTGQRGGGGGGEAVRSSLQRDSAWPHG